MEVSKKVVVSPSGMQVRTSHSEWLSSYQELTLDMQHIKYLMVGQIGSETISSVLE
jgi:hypothetical protein